VAIQDEINSLIRFSRHVLAAGADERLAASEGVGFEVIEGHTAGFHLGSDAGVEGGCSAA